MDDRTTADADELTRQNIESISRLEAQRRSQRSLMDRLAIKVARFAGSAFFIWFHVAFFTAWIVANVVLPTPFDKYPFTFLTLVVSLEAIFLSAFILISQNEAEALAERRANLDLQINLLTEQEDSHALRLLLEIAKKVGVADTDPTVELLQQFTRPEHLAEQIEQVLKRDKKPTRS